VRSVTRDSRSSAVNVQSGVLSGISTSFAPDENAGARSSVNLSLLSYVTPDDPDRSELELRLKRK
jgi:hypothetical protein